MADKALSSLTAASTLDGTELAYVVQSSNSRKVTLAGLLGFPHSQAWSGVTSTPTTLSGYGITDAQAKDSDLTAIAALSASDGGFMVGNGTTWTVETGSTARASLGLAIGTDVQAYSADLGTIAGLSKTDGGVIIGNGTSWTLETGATLRTSLGLSIGSDVQAYNASLTSMAGLSLAAGDILYSTGANALDNLPKGTDGQVLQLVSGLPSWSSVAGTGDMVAAVYDPDATGASAFDMDNMVEGADTKILTAAERALIAGAAQSDDLADVATSGSQDDMVDGTTNKNFTATEKTKLSGIEALADVTDATNVAAAGAAMAASNLSDLASIPTSASNLGIIRNVVKIYAADGGGTNPNDTAFGNANTAGGLIFIPKPATKYAFTSSFTTTAAAWLPDPSISWANLTDSGKFNLYRGHFTGTGNGSNQWRLSDRVFIGDAASTWAGVNVAPGGIFEKDAGTSWFGEAVDGPAYLGVGASLLSIAPDNTDSGLRIAGCFAARGSDSGKPAMGLAAHVENTRSSGTSSWATYFSAWHKDGAAGAGNWTYASETEVVDSSGVSIPVVTAYGVDTGAMGYWIQCGGHGQYGPNPTRPSISAITIGRAGVNALGWQAGITFINSGIYGTDGSSGSSTYGYAIRMGRMHKMAWDAPDSYTSGGTEAASIASTITAVANRVRQQFADNSIFFRGVNDTPILWLSHTASGQNYLSIANNASSSRPTITATGSDTNVTGRLTAKGTGGWDITDGGGATKIGINTTGIGFFAATPVARKTMAAATGTATRTTFDTASVTLPQLAERVKALIDDLRSYGLHA